MYSKKTQKNSKRLEKHKLLYNGGGIFGGISDFVIHTETDLSLPLDKYESRVKSIFKQPKRGLMQITYNRGLPNTRILNTSVNNSDGKPLSDTQTATKPHIIINSDNKYLVVLVEIIPNGGYRLLWALNIYSRTIKQDLLDYIAPAPVTASNYQFRIYAYPKGQTKLSSTLQTILYQRQQRQQSQTQKQPSTQLIAKPMNNLKFQSSGLNITRTKEYKTLMEYISKNNMKLITTKQMKVYKDKSSGTAILSKIME
jgi:hypothetical protein